MGRDSIFVSNSKGLDELPENSRHFASVTPMMYSLKVQPFLKYTIIRQYCLRLLLYAAVLLVSLLPASVDGMGSQLCCLSLLTVWIASCVACLC